MEKITWEMGATIAGILSFIGVLINITLTASQSKKQRTAEFITRNRVEWMQKLKEYISEYNGIVSCYYYDSQVPEDLGEYFSMLNNVTSKIKLHLNFKGEIDKVIISKIEMLNKSLEKFFQVTKNQDLLNESGYKVKIPIEIIEFYITMYPYVGEKFIEDREKLFRLIVNKDEYHNGFSKELIEWIDRDLKNCINKIKYGPELIMLLVQIYLKTEWERVKKESVNGKARKFDFDKEYEKIKLSVSTEVDRLESLINQEFEYKTIKK